jgi:hypothetical protein
MRICHASGLYDHLNKNYSGMKKTHLLFSIVAILTLSFSSCKNDDKNEARYISYATITDGANKVIVTDNESITLYVEQNSGVVAEWKDGKRLVVDCTVLRKLDNATTGKVYYVKVNQVYDVLTKYPVMQSFLNTKERDDSIGHDSINLHEIWFANAYLNMNFGIYRSDPGIKHFINLVVDDSKSTPNDVYAELRHKAYSDLRSVYSLGNISFNVSGLVVSPKTSVRIHLSRKTYSGEMKTDTVTYEVGVAKMASEAAIVRSGIK